MYMYMYVGFIDCSCQSSSIQFKCSLIANEQPLGDARLRGSSIIEPCVIVPGTEKNHESMYSNVRQHL